MVQLRGFNSTRKKREVNLVETAKDNPVAFIFISTPLFILMCIVVASSSIQEELDLTRLRHRNNRIKTDLMDKKYNEEEIHKKGSHALWDLLIDEAEALQKETEKPIHVMDVGMWKPQDCLRAANHGLDAHCIEPSPLSNKRIMEGFHEATEEDRKHIRFYKMAAAATTGKLLLFQSGGTQSDHIGDCKYTLQTYFY